MGAADVVPGVSGGTIAFITGIYNTLISALSNLNLQALKLLQKRQWKAFWTHIHGTFLLVLFAGIATSIVSFAKLFSYLIQNHPVPLWAFFFGLILAGALYMLRKITAYTPVVVLTFLLGTLSSFYITLAAPASGPDSLPYLFLSGLIAICAMVLPGISGSFILLIMGSYATVLGALNNLEILRISVFLSGAVIGILSFARLVQFLLNSYHNVVIALLTGFMTGSLNKVWPWKRHIENRLNSKGEWVAFIDKNVLPGDYSVVSEADKALGFTQKDPQWVAAIVLFLLAMSIVFFLSVRDKNNA